MLDVMIDLETMDTATTAAIVAIGAVEFDVESGALGRSLYLPVQLASSVAAGGTMSPDTVLWWMQQPDDARRELWSGDGQTLERALTNLRRWLEMRPDGQDVRVWGNGAAFDNVVLRGAYERLGLPPPWKWSNDRCYRTLRKLQPQIEPPPREGTAHHALDDAVHQARHAALLLRLMPQLRRVGAGDGNTFAWS